SDALGNLNICMQNHPEMVELYLLRALVHGERGNQARSSIDPKDPARTRLLQEQAAGAFEAAEADYRRALERQPTEDLRYVLLVNRGGMYLQADRFAESLGDLELAIRLKPGPYQAYSHLAQLSQRRGQMGEASRALGEAIARAPDPATEALLRRSRA